MTSVFFQSDPCEVSGAINEPSQTANTADFLPLLSMLETESPCKGHFGKLDRARIHAVAHGKSDSTGSVLQHQLVAKKNLAYFESMSIDSGKISNLAASGTVALSSPLQLDTDVWKYLNVFGCL